MWLRAGIQTQRSVWTGQSLLDKKIVEKAKENKWCGKNIMQKMFHSSVPWQFLL